MTMNKIIKILTKGKLPMPKKVKMDSVKENYIKEDKIFENLCALVVEDSEIPQKILIYCVLFASIFYLTGCSQKTQTMMCPNTTKKTSIARYKVTMKPYKVSGKDYFPRQVHVGEKMYGISSWYGPNFHGKCTSNGEKYNMYARTAAHKTLPMDTIVRVKNLQNGKSTVVRINDRGPFIKGRIIDCSYKAGKELGLDKMGIAKVQVEVLRTRNSIVLPKKKMLLSRNKSIGHTAGTEKIGIQLGAFENYEGAKRLKEQYRNKYVNYYPVIHEGNTVEGKRLYRVVLLGFHSKDEANIFKKIQSV